MHGVFFGLMSETGFEKDDVKGINKLYNEKPGTVGGKHNDYTAGSNSAPINGQRDIFSASNIIKPERNSDTMHVWCNLGNCAESEEELVRIDSQRTMLQVHLKNLRTNLELRTLLVLRDRLWNDIFRLLWRVFQLDDESQFLCPLGDSPEEAQKYSTDGVELEWSCTRVY
ncbi:8432_t:CDS:2 [Rhizophagus irregularis]|nr:8432_t:CDS:2 [Rhizophagus irregularis]